MNIKVVKRDGRIVSFNEERIRTAIEKGLASVNLNQSTNVDRVLGNVIQNIENFNSSKIEIERIQDFVEEAFLDCGFVDAYKSFKRYRKDRAIAREHFSKGQHKLLKTIENLTAKDSLDDSAMNLMFKFGNALSNSYAEAYLLKEEVNNANKSGDIFIHDLEYYPMGTTASIQLPLDKLFKGGFSIGNTNIREPQSIESYAALCVKAIQANLNDQHGEQVISMFDYYMKDGVLKSFKKNYIKELEDYHDFTGSLSDLEVVEITNKINDLNAISNLQIEGLDLVFKKALALTDRQTYQAIEALMFNLNTTTSNDGKKPHVTFYFGTDTTIEGRMVSKNLILVKENDESHKTLISPALFFKCKEGVSYETNDPNYDLFKLAIRSNSKGNTINFSFTDSSLEEVSKGNLSSTTINLVRLGLKHCSNTEDVLDLEGFYEDLFRVMDLVKYQLIDRLNFQKQKKANNFKFLMGQNLWLGSSYLKDEDALNDILNVGTLAIGFTGLAECLKALTGKDYSEDEETYKLGLEIISKFSNKCNQYSKETGLNFVSLATNDEAISQKFVSLDKEEYGEVEGVTTKETYSCSFLIPSSDISKEEKAVKEGSFHNLVNTGAISYIELEYGSKNIEDIEKAIAIMHDSNFKQGALKLK